MRCIIYKYIYCFNKYKYYLCRFSDSSARDSLGFGIVVGLSKHVIRFESDVSHVTNQTDYDADDDIYDEELVQPSLYVLYNIS